MRNNRKWILWTFVVGLAVMMAGVVSAVAQEAPAAPASAAGLPTVDQILDKYVSALGGKEAIQKVTSRVSKGTLEMEQMQGGMTLEIYAKAPNKILTVMQSPAVGSIKRGFDGEKGWQDTPQTGLADLSGAQLEQLKQSADFYGDLNLKTLYPKMTLKGEESVGGHQAYVIAAESPNGNPATMYFDADSGLEVRTVTQVQGPDGPMEADTILGDYRDVDGVKVPFTIQESFGQFGFTMKFADVKANVPIDDAKFEKPAQQ